MSKKPPHEWQDPRFPSKALLKASQCLHRLPIMLVPCVPQVYDAHAPDHPCDVKENVNNPIRPLSSITPSMSDAYSPIVGGFGSEHGSAAMVNIRTSNSCLIRPVFAPQHASMSLAGSPLSLPWAAFNQLQHPDACPSFNFEDVSSTIRLDYNLSNTWRFLPLLPSAPSCPSSPLSP